MNNPFKSEEISKIRIISLEEFKDKIIERLHELGLIEISQTQFDNHDNPSEYVNDINLKLLNLENLLNFYTVYKIKPIKKIYSIKSLKDANNLYKKNKVDKLIKTKTRISKLKEDLSEIKDAIEYIKLFDLDDGLILAIKNNKFNYKALIFNKKYLNNIIKIISNSSNVIYYKYNIVKNNVYLILLFMKDSNDIGINIEHTVITFSKMINKLDLLNKEKTKIEKELNILLKEMEISRNRYTALLALYEFYKIQMERENVKNFFGKTERTFIIESWAPLRDIEIIENNINEITKGKYFIEKIKTNELPPTYIKLPRFAKPFYELMSLINIPRSDEINPFLIFLITFPIFYGIMISDVGYGLLALIFAALLKKRYYEGMANSVLTIIELSSIFAIIFGFLFDSFFGIKIDHYFGFNGIDFLPNIINILELSLIFGIVQISIGLVFGFINNIKKGKKRAISKASALLFIDFGSITVIAFLFLHIYNYIAYISLAITLISLITYLYYSGMEGIEITTLISHPLSYSRIMGFSVASMVIALLIDRAFTPNPSYNIVVFIFYLLIFLVLHMLNLSLSVLEATVQTLRLNVVEFFTKFIEGNGKNFQPFKIIKRYIK